MPDVALADPVVVALAPRCARFSFRGRGQAVTAAGQAFGIVLPTAACRAAARDERAALWLGPDEWLLLAPDPTLQSEGASLSSAIALACGSLPHALVDISHRQLGLTVTGPAATDTLNAGCPLDLHPSAFPVGMCTRTVLAKTEIVLWRTAADRFRLEVWRSFAPYARRFLEEASREFRR